MPKSKRKTSKGGSRPGAGQLRSVCTSNLPALLEQLNISLAVSTYQAGKVILVRNDGGKLNTHFRDYEKPMGLAGDYQRLAIGSTKTVWTLRNIPAVAPKLAPPGVHDACFLPRRIHVTGDIDIHELGYDKDGELWLVNTRFGCLCTLDAEHSFHPRWRPPFLSAYAPEDRCHLNGLALVDGRPKYVTALGETDTAGGWRENKARGGILMDVETDEIVLRGLSMPHSPRWHQGQLWLLESGEGSIARVDLAAGSWETVARVPGFTRGLDFVGPLAFVGLSQVRETAVFSGIPLVKRLRERTCGVWVVDLRNGQTVAFLRFEEGVEEIFAVQVLPGIRFPEMLEWNDDKLKSSYVLPDAALAEVPPERLEPGALGTAAAPPPRPGASPEPFAEAYNRGVALRERGARAQAAAAFEQALAQRPDSADAHNDLAVTLSALGRRDEAIVHYEQAIARRPDFAVAHRNLGMLLLQRGDFPRGFAEFEWRWDTPGFMPLVCPKPKWNGEDLTGKRILVHTEQGAGDTIQCLRFLPSLAERAARVILVAPEPLRRLLESARGFDELRGVGTIPLDAFDVYAPLMSLPLHLGVTVETIPAEIPYIAPPPKPLLIPAPAPGVPFKVGIVWSGSTTFGGNQARACPAEAFARLLAVPGVSFYSLQVGPPAGKLGVLRKTAPVANPAERFEDWADTAGAVAQLDLVIGVDTGVLHLAGALGKPGWVLLAHDADWRWLLGREDTPWYPTLRLFRQPEPGAWGVLVERVAAALGETAAGRVFEN